MLRFVFHAHFQALTFIFSLFKMTLIHYLYSVKQKGCIKIHFTIEMLSPSDSIWRVSFSSSYSLFFLMCRVLHQLHQIFYTIPSCHHHCCLYDAFCNVRNGTVEWKYTWRLLVFYYYYYYFVCVFHFSVHSIASKEVWYIPVLNNTLCSKTDISCCTTIHNDYRKERPKKNIIFIFHFNSIRFIVCVFFSAFCLQINFRLFYVSCFMFHRLLLFHHGFLIHRHAMLGECKTDSLNEYIFF